MWRMWFAVWWLSGIAVWALEAELRLSPGPAGVDIAQVSSDLMLLPAAEKVLPGQLVYVYVALQGEAPPAGTARWEGRLQRLAADGAAAVLPAAEFRAAAGGGMLQPAPDCRSLQLLGVYTVPAGSTPGTVITLQATVREVTPEGVDEEPAEVWTSRPAALTVEALPPVSRQPEGAAAPDNRFAMSFYYLMPEPGALISLYFDFLRTFPTAGAPDDRKIVVLSWFYQAFKLNPQLWPALVDAVLEESGQTARDVTTALLLQLEAPPEILAPLGDFARFYGDRWEAGYFETAQVIAPMQLDFLWTEFTVTGRCRPIEKIAGALALMEDGMSPEAFAALEQPTPEDRRKQVRYLIASAAEWSLGRQAAQHELVRRYCGRLAADETVPEPVRKKLRRILATVETPKE